VTGPRKDGGNGRLGSTPTEEISPIVQDCLHDRALTVTQRATKAVTMIAEALFTELELPPGTILEIPADWAHKIPTDWIIRPIVQAPDLRGSATQAQVVAVVNCWCGSTTVEGMGQRCEAVGDHDPMATGRPKRIDWLYVAGPMTGYPECNYPAFHDAAERLRQEGYLVVNPAEDDNDGHYVDILRDDIKALLTCHGVALLDNWWESPGARTEVQVAGLLMMPCRTVDEWLARTDKELPHLRPLRDAAR
jgi:hypothetical protein